MNVEALLAQVEQMRAGSGRPRAKQPHRGESWCSIAQKGDTAEVSIYDEIGLWGVTAKEFAADLKSIEASRITLRVNSPGGDVFDALTIYNVLRRHPANITATVDGIAASAASFIVQAADTRLISEHAMMMIHNAWALSIGDADHMEAMGRRLREVNELTGDIYAQRSGRPLGTILAEMRAETWYSSGAKAVEAGMADDIDPETGGAPSDDPSNRWDLSVFNNFRHTNVRDSLNQSGISNPEGARNDALRRALEEAFTR